VQGKKQIIQKSDTSGQLLTYQSTPDFEPRVKVIHRILKIMSEQVSIQKTKLSLLTNLNYVRLSNTLSWLERKELIKSVIVDNKVHFVLTSNDRLFFQCLE
jgi:predicted transcriptional regulator